MGKKKKVEREREEDKEETGGDGELVQIIADVVQQMVRGAATEAAAKHMDRERARLEQKRKVEAEDGSGSKRACPFAPLCTHVQAQNDIITRITSLNDRWEGEGRDGKR